MSWNEPGGGNNRPRDPWGGNDQGPPDLDEALKKLQQRISGLFGGRGSGGSSAGGSSGGGLSGALLGSADSGGRYRVGAHGFLSARRAGARNRSAIW